jgi:hypothetical protein
LQLLAPTTDLGLEISEGANRQHFGIYGSFGEMKARHTGPNDVNNTKQILRKIMRNKKCGCAYRPEKLLNVSGIGVHDELVNFLLPHFPQHLSIRSGTGLANIHFSPCGSRRLHQFLQLEQS